MPQPFHLFLQELLAKQKTKAIVHTKEGIYPFSLHQHHKVFAIRIPIIAFSLALSIASSLSFLGRYAHNYRKITYRTVENGLKAVFNRTTKIIT
jgi:hypothetical protein